MRHTFFVALILLIINPYLSSYAHAGSKSFYHDKARGFFWGEDPRQVSAPVVPDCVAAGQGSIFWDFAGITHSVLRIQDSGVVSRDQFGKLSQLPFQSIQCEAPTPPKEMAKTEPPTEQPEQVAEVTPPPGPAPLSAKWFRENLTEFRDAALDDPNNPSKVRAYLYLQHVMMDKAENFSQTYQDVVMGDPFLEETDRFPTANFGSQSYEKMASESRKSLAKELGQKAGLFFFYDKTCTICGQQAYVLKVFEQIYGMKVMPVSLDGSKLDPGHLQESLTDSGQSEAMGIKKVPALVLASPEKGTFRAISQGTPLAMDELVKKTLVAAKTLALITPEQYDTSLSVRGHNKLINLEYEQFTPEIMEDPRRLVETIRKMGEAR